MNGISLSEVSFVVLSVVSTIFWIWTLVDCAVFEPRGTRGTITWLVLIGVTHWVGAALYQVLRRPQRVAELGR